MAASPPRILHLFPTFEAGPAAIRAVALINAHGRKAEHAIVADDRGRGARPLLAKAPRVTWPDFPPLEGNRLPGRLLKLAGAMAGYDLICTWGAGALGAALAHTLFADVHKLAPLVHHELEASPQEVGGRVRGWYRRFALGRTAALIVPTRALEAVALGAWDQPRTRVRLILDGIDTRAFAIAPPRDLLPGLVKRPEELWLGTFAHALGPDPLLLVRALEQMPSAWQLVILNEGNSETGARAALEEEAAALGIEDRLHFPALVGERGGALALFDCLVLPAPAQGGRLPLIEAMAAGMPLVGVRASQADELVSTANGPLLVDPDDADALIEALRQVGLDAQERRRIGQANRAKAREEYDARRMAERSWALYDSLMGSRVPAGDH